MAEKKFHSMKSIDYTKIIKTVMPQKKKRSSPRERSGGNRVISGFSAN